jgi:hypothetical protein
MMPNMTASPKQESESARPPLLCVWLLLLILPLLAISPALAPGHRLLSQLPVASEPLSLEYPVASALAAEGMNYSTSDRLFPVLTDQTEARAQLAAGTLPTWDPHLGAGVPLFGGSIAGLAYPLNWFGLLFAPDVAAAPLALLSLFLAGLGMWLFLGARKLSFEAAIAGALLMQSSLWGFTNLHDFMKVDAALWLPWMLLGIERVRARQGGGLLIISGAGGLSLLAGFYSIAVFGLFTAGLYAVFSLASRPKLLGRALLALVLATGIGAWQLLPAAEASRLSNRQGADASALAAQALPTATSAALLFPDLFGAPDEIATSTYDPAAAALIAESDKAALAQMNALEWNVHFGSLALLLGLLALVTRPKQALAPLGLLLFWFGYAQAWPGFGWLYHVPGLNLGAPGRAMALGWPLFAWLGALGVESIVREARVLRAHRDPDLQHAALQSEAPLPKRLPFGASLAAGLLGLAAMTLAMWGWQRLDPLNLAPGLIERLAARFDYSTTEVAALIPPAAIQASAERVHAAFGAWFASGLLLVCAALFVRMISGRTLLGRGTLAMALALAIALAPRLASGAFEFPLNWTALLVLGAGVIGLLLLHAPSLSVRARPEWAHPAWQHTALPMLLLVGLSVETLDVAPRHLRPRAVQPDLRAATSELSATVPLWPDSVTIDAIAATTAENGRVVRVDQSPNGVGEVIRLARPNLLTAYGLRDLTPYIVFTPKTLIELVQTVDSTAPFRSGIAAIHKPETLGSPVLDALRVTTVLATHALEPLPPTLTLAYSRPDFFVYKRSGSLPTAVLVPEASVALDDAQALAQLGADDFDPRARMILAPDVELPDAAVLNNAPDPNSEVIVRSPSASRLDVKVTTSVGGWLLMTEQFAPDWKVNIDGQDAVMLRANHALRALWIPPGEHLVRTWYEPWSLRYGCILMLLACVVIMRLTWLERRWTLA